MAADWIKMRMGLRTHPKVVRISSALNADRFRVIGALHAVWCLADEHTEDGSLPGYSLSALDDSIGWQGFSKAVKDVSWLEVTAQGLVLPRFDEHNGQSAKRRATEAERKRRDRNPSAEDADKKRTRERERERTKTPIPPSGAFLRFWGAWPKSARKQAQGKCWERWRKADFDQVADVIIAHVEAMRVSAEWRREAGQFIPAPMVYLNDRRWEGAELPAEVRRIGQPGVLAV
jgi:hypothetical protein